MTQDPGSSKRKGRSPSTGVPVVVRLQPLDLAALDAYIAAHPEPKPTRPEAIRRVLADRLVGNSSRKTAMAPDVAAKAAKVRSKAADRADVEMKSMDGTADEKSRRRAALVEKPAMVAKARGKRKGGSK